MNREEIIKELKGIEAQVAALIKKIEPQTATSGVKVTVGELRKAAILEEIYLAGGAVTPKELSSFAVRYGRTPGSCAGYFSGKKPSLKSSQDKSERVLTDLGNEFLKSKREKWGEDWLNRIPHETVGNIPTPDSLEVYF